MPVHTSRIARMRSMNSSAPHPEREGELVDAVERRLELLRDLELGRRRARR